MTKRREESDGRVVPEGRRKAVPTAEVSRGGKASTDSKTVGQLRLPFEQLKSRKGPTPNTVDQATRSRRGVPKSRGTSSTDPPTMTMEEVASEANLRRAFEVVAGNKGAAGPDGQRIEDVREHLEEILAVTKRELLEGRYQPGMIRRKWIPKPGGGERGLGIPNVVDRVVQQAVHHVLGPNYEPTFHDGSHGFRPGRSCHTAIAAAKQHMKDGHRWVVDIDLEKFLDHAS